MREIAKGPDDPDGLIRRQAGHDGLQLLPGGLVGVAVELDGGAADVLDEPKHPLALLGTHGVPQDSPEQPYGVA